MSPAAKTLGAQPLGQALTLLQAGRPAEAERICRELLAAEPANVGALHLRGLALMRSGHNREAVDALRAALALGPGNAECSYHLGLALVALGHKEEAGAQFARAIDLDATHVAAYVCLGNVLTAAGDFDAAASHYGRALSLDPRSAIAHRNLANLQRQRGQPEEAILHFKRAVELEPDDSDSHNDLGNCYLRRGELESAIAHYRAALLHRPAFIEAHNNLGIALRSQGSLSEALASFERSLALDPARPGTQLNLCATIYQWSIAEPQPAVELARRLLDAHRDQPLMHRALAGLLGLDLEEPRDAQYSKELFDQFAPVFDQTLARLRYDDMVQATARALGLPQARVADVLDAGCGTGLCGSAVRSLARSLTGVDISPKMLEQARSLAIYDRLVCEDAVAFMARSAAAFDAIISSDVVTYVGEVSGFVRAAHHALRAGGRIAVSAESLDEPGGTYRLSPSGRYRHTRAYLEASLRAAGFAIAQTLATPMRMEAGHPAPGWIVVAEKRS
jgi:predicted TPR repeat methyltransferase